jgi:hypothetical protein
VGKREKLGGFRLNNHLLPPPRFRTERGREAARGRPAGGNCRRAGPRRRSGSSAKRRGLHGYSIPLPTLGWDGVQKWVLGGGGREVVVLGAVALGCLGRRGIRL